MKPTPNRELQEKRVGPTTVLLDRSAGKYFHLNDTAAEYWDLLAGGCGFDEAVERIARSYGREIGEVREDLRNLTERMAAHGLVSLPEEG